MNLMVGWAGLEGRSSRLVGCHHGTSVALNGSDSFLCLSLCRLSCLASTFSHIFFRLVERGREFEQPGERFFWTTDGFR